MTSQALATGPHEAKVMFTRDELVQSVLYGTPVEGEILMRTSWDPYRGVICAIEVDSDSGATFRVTTAHGNIGDLTTSDKPEKYSGVELRPFVTAERFSRSELADALLTGREIAGVISIDGIPTLVAGRLKSLARDLNLPNILNVRIGDKAGSLEPRE